NVELHCGDGEWPWSTNEQRVEGSRSRSDDVKPDIMGWPGMIAVTAQTRIWVAVEPADFRCGIDGLARVCRQKLKADPFCGALFVFRNRRSTSGKILAYYGSGFWLCQKCASKGRFGTWPKIAE